LSPDDAACVLGVNVLNGTLAQIVAALGTPGNVTYRGLPDFFGTDTLTMTTATPEPAAHSATRTTGRSPSSRRCLERPGTMHSRRCRARAPSMAKPAKDA